MAAISPTESLRSPFGDLATDLSESELRETAYEILISACRSSGVGRPLTFKSQSERNNSTPSTVAGPSLQRSLTSTAASKVKKALGMKSGRNRSGGCDAPSQIKKAVTVGELVRVQMQVSETTDSRIRRALLRIASSQLGRRTESMVLPLELLQQLKSLDFSDQQEFEAWQRRNLKVLEAGLLFHAHLPLSKTDTAPQQLRQMIRSAMVNPIETGKYNESMQSLRKVVTSLASRTLDGSVSEISHWADGFPLNVKLYQLLLEACFDINDETLVIEEVDEVLELVKKTWVILGINQMLHNACFLWLLFYRYVSTSQVESDLLFAANNLLVEIEKDASVCKDPDYSKILSSMLNSILSWSEKRLLSYHDTFNSDNIESMENVVSLAVLAAKILAENVSHEHIRKKKQSDVGCDTVDSYIRSSSRVAFSQIMKMVEHSRRTSKNQQNRRPLLSILAEDTSHLAFNEKAIFSPILKRWHPLAAGVAVATLHACFGVELNKFVSGIDELTPDAIQVLVAADKLEKDLVQIAVEESVNSEDGGKSIIKQMPPYEAESVIADLVRSWLKTRVDRLEEWVDRSLQQEVWNTEANKGRFASSAVEVLRLVDETSEAFFLLPIPNHPVLLPELISGLDKCLQLYISKAKSGCGSRSTFVPTLPGLTRCATGSKLAVFKRKEKPLASQRRKSQVGSTDKDNTFGILQLCCQINTLHHIRIELEIMGKKLMDRQPNYIVNSKEKFFDLSICFCVEGVRQLCEATAYRVVFHDLSHLLWDGLYIGEVSSSRIEHFVEELERYLVFISSTVHDRVRTRVIADMMKASFDGFLLVLLAGGSSRAFTRQDSDIIQEDFKLLKDLFWSNGDGLPSELIEKCSSTVNSILPLFRIDTDTLIERFKSLTLENYGPTKSRLPLPPMAREWSPTEPNTLLRVLCHRSDEMATRFLKKTYNLPKKL